MLTSVEGGRDSDLGNARIDGTTWCVRRQRIQDCATNHVLPSTEGGKNSDLGHARIDGITWFVRRQRTQDYAARTDYMNGPRQRGL